ncbi:MAG: hypothetical protein JNK04_15580 [Myxococcales bacterium]|nr:hypothetical protein [Myxococcales bacterium]
MASSFMKRQKERQREEKQKEKEQKRAERERDKANRPEAEAGVDPDLVGIVPGPQPVVDWE